MSVPCGPAGQGLVRRSAPNSEEVSQDHAPGLSGAQGRQLLVFANCGFGFEREIQRRRSWLIVHDWLTIVN